MIKHSSWPFFSTPLDEASFQRKSFFTPQRVSALSASILAAEWSRLSTRAMFIMMLFASSDDSDSGSFYLVFKQSANKFKSRVERNK
jgi:hypothetical protein